MSDIGDGTGNEVLVTGAVFMIVSSYPGAVDVSIPEDEWNVVEFGLDFMQSRYRATITKVDDG